MTTKTIDNVLPDIEEWKSQYGDFMYSVTAFFDDRTLLRATKKDRLAALELQGMLSEVIGQPQDFVVEESTAKSGAPKYKLLAFGPEGQPYTYSTLKDGKVPGGGGGAPSTNHLRRGDRSPEHDVDASIRRAVALKAAAIAAQGLDTKRILVMAEEFEAWLKTSPEVAAAPDEAEQASGGTTSVSADDGGGQGDEAGSVSGSGEASCPPHQLNLDVAAKAGRYPCRKCGAWINPRGGITE